MCNIRIREGRRGGSRWIPLAEVVLVSRGGRPFPNTAVRQAMLSDQGQAQAIVSRCFDGNISTSCFDKGSAVTVSSLTAEFPCPGSGTDGLDKVVVYNTQ